jgi:ankyrin repeat protein
MNRQAFKELARSTESLSDGAMIMNRKGISALFFTVILSLLLISVSGHIHKYRQAAFSRASWLGDTKTMRVLLAAGADVNEPIAAYINPLVAASESGNPEAIHLLLDHRADINQRDEYGWTALMYATGAGQVKSVQVLISRGADVSAVGRRGSALSIATQTNHPEIVNILKQAGAR